MEIKQETEPTWKYCARCHIEREFLRIHGHLPKPIEIGYCGWGNYLSSHTCHIQDGKN